MRDELANVTLPAIPFLGMLLSVPSLLLGFLVLQDLTFIEEGNPDQLPGSAKLINWSKMRLTARILEQIKEFQKLPFNFVPIPSIQVMIAGVQPTMTDSEAYQLSLKIEPREKD